LAQNTKTGGNVLDWHYIIKWPLKYTYVMAKYIPNFRGIYQPFQFQDPPKFTQIGISGLKICHLATLVRGRPRHLIVTLLLL
jgi:hypothetical protein